jgi:hypothetical protein
MPEFGTATFLPPNPKQGALHKFKKNSVARVKSALATSQKQFFAHLV